MESLKVRDIMQVEVVTIGPEASVRELSVLLGEKGVSGVPVVDGQGKVVGVVSEGDVILQDAELHFPHYVQFLDSVIFLESVQRFADRFRKAFGAKVSDIMSKEVKSIGPDAGVGEVATLMADENINRIPVIQDGRLKGIVTRADVVRALPRIWS